MNSVYLGYIWCVLAAVASAASTYLIKMSGQVADGGNLLRFLYLGVACGSYGLGFICYTFALQRLQISVAYPVMTGVTMALVTAAGYVVLHEALTPIKITGLLLVSTGVVFLAR